MNRIVLEASLDKDNQPLKRGREERESFAILLQLHERCSELVVSSPAIDRSNMTLFKLSVVSRACSIGAILSKSVDFEEIHAPSSRELKKEPTVYYMPNASSWSH